MSKSILRRCTRTDTFINKLSNLSALAAQTFLSSCWDCAWPTITSKYDDASEDAFYQVEELRRSFGITWSLINLLKMFARKLISRKSCRRRVPKTLNVLYCWSTANGVFVCMLFHRLTNHGLTITTSVNSCHVLSCPTLHMYDAQVTNAL